MKNRSLAVAARSGIEVRRFVPRHMDRVLEIERCCFARDAYPRDLFAELYRDCGGLFFVAKRSGRIAGYAVTCVSGSAAEVISIAVDPRRRKSGIGTALLKHTVMCLKRSRVRLLRLMVRVGNSDAIRFYRRFGFRAVGRISRYYEDRTDGLLMRRRV